MKAMYEAVVTSQGGRDGHVKSSDGILDFKVSLPKTMGGRGDATNPEQLFAAGYAACYENAILHIAKKMGTEVKKSSVTAHVSIGANATGGFQLAVRLEVSLPGMEKAKAESLSQEAHKICPYSNATRGNIEVEIHVVS